MLSLSRAVGVLVRTSPLAKGTDFPLARVDGGGVLGPPILDSLSRVYAKKDFGPVRFSTGQLLTEADLRSEDAVVGAEVSRKSKAGVHVDFRESMVDVSRDKAVGDSADCRLFGVVVRVVTLMVDMEAFG
jgi:hypothetical protein